MTLMGNTPVDIAGFMGQPEIVLTFCRDLEQRILVENKVRMENAGSSTGPLEPSGDAEAAAVEKTKMSQVSPGLASESMVGRGREIQREMGNTFEKTADDKLLINCLKVKQAQLSHEETIDMHCFYWAAFYGLNKYLRYMVLSRRWSPFIKSFQNRSVISGAVWGERVETLRMLLGDYQYENVSALNILDFASQLYNKDQNDNNCLHYCYMIDLPEVR